MNSYVLIWVAPDCLFFQGHIIASASRTSFEKAKATFVTAVQEDMRKHPFRKHAEYTILQVVARGMVPQVYVDFEDVQ